jgi:hypothetical protein
MKNSLNALVFSFAFIYNIQLLANNPNVAEPQLVIKQTIAPIHCLGQSYYKFVIQASNGVVTVNKGIVVADTIKNVEEGSTPLIITVTAPDGQTIQKTILLPAVDAFPPQPAIAPTYVVCQGSPLPLITAIVLSINTTVDWYDQPVGGTKVATGSLTYQPTEAKTYYALSRDISTGCVAGERTAANMIVQSTKCIVFSVAKIRI